MTAKQIYQDALKNKYALCAFNFVNLEVLKAIIKTCEEENKPVILQASESAIDFIGEDFLKGYIAQIKKTAQTPIIFHLDHGKSLEVCKRAISIGFNSVMIDASSLSFEKNIALTKQVVNYAHKKHIWVEAELGSLSGIEDNINIKNGKAAFTDPKEAREFVLQTKTDSLAIAIGTSHGVNKFLGEPNLRLDILTEIETLIPNYPLVLHGASSIDEDKIAKINAEGAAVKDAKGVPQKLLKTAIKNHNIIKVNIDSDLRLAYTFGIRKSLNESRENIDIRKYTIAAQNQLSKVVKDKLKLITEINKKSAK
ncbi:MAG: class II fructose-bisphosphate aldolase [Clostridia bacterium]